MNTPPYGPGGTAYTEPPVVPHDLQAEQAVLGAILVNEEKFFEVADIIGADDFFRAAHQTIFFAMHAIASKGEKIDFRTLIAFLSDMGDLERVGGPAYVAGLADGVPRTTNADAYARIVKGKATRAKLRQAALRIADAAQNGGGDTAELLDEAQREIFSLADDKRGDFLPPATLVLEGMKYVDAIASGDRSLVGIPTGWADLDAQIRGLRPGNLILVAGRPSMGKTAFALNLALNIAFDQGKVVGLMSLEMSRDELVIRMVSSLGRVDAHRLQQGYLNDKDYGRISEAFCQIGNSKLYVDDTPELGVFDLRSKARRLQSRVGLDVLIVDYLQLMKAPKAENRNVAIAEVSRGLKLAARELKIPLIVLSQLSRDSEKRGAVDNHEAKRPLLSDLRDSGALEQDADVVMFIHRPEYYEHDKPDLRGIAEIIVGKQRNGPTGIVKLCWQQQQQRFENLARY